ncbi:MAG: TonB family protein [Acidobacteria bacterium]|nr:TonB family protein [Acidobacteriota bacterium]
MLLRLALVILLLGCAPVFAQTAGEPRPRVAVLDFGQTETGRSASDALAASLAKDRSLKLVDRELTRMAAAGMGYTGSLNMTLDEARDLGAAIGCDFLITGDAQALRRSSSDAPAYHEAYASIFFISARTGRLVMWSRPSKRASKPDEAEKSLLEELRRNPILYRLAMLRWREDEKARGEPAATGEEIVYEVAPEEGSAEAAGFRPPAPYRRVRPPYTETAAAAEVEATVDAQVEIGADGEVARVEIVRWAGFGLDESVAATVRRMHFRPAMRDGAPVPVRVLLRYNFRRPPKAK